MPHAFARLKRGGAELTPLLWFLVDLYTTALAFFGIGFCFCPEIFHTFSFALALRDLVRCALVDFVDCVYRHFEAVCSDVVLRQYAVFFFLCRLLGILRLPRCWILRWLFFSVSPPLVLLGKWGLDCWCILVCLLLFSWCYKFGICFADITRRAVTSNATCTQKFCELSLDSANMLLYIVGSI